MPHSLAKADDRSVRPPVGAGPTPGAPLQRGRGAQPHGRAEKRALNIVLIAYAFPPYSAAGSARAAKVAEAFRQEGHSVYVITSRLPGEGPGPRVVKPGLTVQPVATLPHPRQLVVQTKRLFRRDAGAATGEGRTEREATEGASGKRTAWKRVILSLLLLPDDLQGFIPPAVLRARSAFSGRVDLVYTTSPPASGHLAGLVLKLLTGVRWVTEFRDPWFPQRGALTSPARDRIEGWLERQCIRRADHVVSVSEGIDEMLRARLPGAAAERCVVVRNGIDSLAPKPEVERAPRQERILYLGTLYWKRNPRLFLRGLALVKERLGLTPDDVMVDFVGNCRSFGAESVEAMVEELGLTGFVRFHDWLRFDEAQRLLDDATLLLLLAQEQPVQVPNKLYEYLGTRKPILAVADHAGETARMLREVGGHYVATELDDDATMADLLEKALRRQPGAAEGRGEAVLQEWRTDHQMRRLMETLGTLASR